MENSELKPVVELEWDGLCQIIPAEDMLHKYHSLQQTTLKISALVKDWGNFNTALT